MEKLETKARIKFRDRALKEGEKSHYYCETCGCEIDRDLVSTHRCRLTFFPEGYYPKINET